MPWNIATGGSRGNSLWRSGSASEGSRGLLDAQSVASNAISPREHATGFWPRQRARRLEPPPPTPDAPPRFPLLGGYGTGLGSCQSPITTISRSCAPVTWPPGALRTQWQVSTSESPSNWGCWGSWLPIAARSCLSHRTRLLPDLICTLTWSTAHSYRVTLSAYSGPSRSLIPRRSAAD